MSHFIDILQVVHVLNAILMAWPFYALVAVNHRAMMGPPLGDRLDVYIEQLIKNRSIPCFIFQGVALVTGVALAFTQGMGPDSFITNYALGFKLFSLLFIAGLLSYVHFKLQPEIDNLFSALAVSADQETAAQIALFRFRRKRVASVCLFVVLTASMLGAQVWIQFPFWLTISLIIAIAFFTLRSYKSPMKFGWI